MTIQNDMKNHQESIKCFGDKDVDKTNEESQSQKQNIVNYIETINRLKNENNFKHEESVKLRKIIKDQSLLIKNLNNEIDYLYLSSLTKADDKKFANIYSQTDT
jgi:uncharacterized coiled-coil DUF342 family protein